MSDNERCAKCGETKVHHMTGDGYLQALGVHTGAPDHAYLAPQAVPEMQPDKCRRCAVGFPLIRMDDGVIRHRGSQSKGMIPDSECFAYPYSSQTPPAPTGNADGGAVCQHGQLARSCEVCELRAALAEAEERAEGWKTTSMGDSRYALREFERLEAALSAAEKRAEEAEETARERGELYYKLAAAQLRIAELEKQLADMTAERDRLTAHLAPALQTATPGEPQSK